MGLDSCLKLADGGIWPAATHRSTWTTHPTAEWHFGHSDSGYTDKAISLQLETSVPGAELL